MANKMVLVLRRPVPPDFSEVHTVNKATKSKGPAETEPSLFGDVNDPGAEFKYPTLRTLRLFMARTIVLSAIFMRNAIFHEKARSGDAETGWRARQTED